MAVNRYKNHLVIYLEDKPYRGIVNGIKSLPNVDEKVIDARPPCGGWPKVFAALEENLAFLNQRAVMFAVLVMDFDNSFDERKQRFDALINGQGCKDRVFLLGIDARESESLRNTLNISNDEALGKFLVQSCPDQTVAAWQNVHLQCNQNELNRMRDAGVFGWLFTDAQVTS